MSGFELSINVLMAVGSFLTGIVMLITMIRVVSRLKLKDEVIYGTEAEERYKNIKDTLIKNGIPTKSYKYEGGNIIVPKLEFEKCHYNSLLMEPELKRYKKRIRFFDNDKMVYTWYLK